MEGCGDQGSNTLDLGDKSHSIVEMESSNNCLGRKALAFAEQYPADLNGKGFITEMQHLPSVHKVNFECAQFNTIGPVELNNTVGLQSENSSKLPL